MRDNQGFTLIELIIVIAIVAILASLSVSAYNHYIIRAQFTEAINLAQGLKQKIQQNRSLGSCYSNNGILSDTDKIVGKYGKAEIIYIAEDKQCGIKYTFNSKGVSNNLTNKVVEFNVNENAILSYSSNTTIESKFMPNSI